MASLDSETSTLQTRLSLSEMVDRDHAAVQDIFREWRSKPISESLWLLEYGWSDVDATHSIRANSQSSPIHVTKEADETEGCAWPTREWR